MSLLNRLTRVNFTRSGLPGAAALRRTIDTEEHERRPVRQCESGDASRASPPRGIVAYLKNTLRDFIDDDCPSMAAALAYYTTFSLPPLLLIVISVAGLVLGREAVQGKLRYEIQGLIGPSAAEQVQAMVQEAGKQESAGVLGVALGILALAFGATTAFAQLQAALNKAWQVKPDPKAGVRAFLTKRVLSLGMVLGVGFLLMVSLVLSAALSAVGDRIGTLLPQTVSGAMLHTIQLGVSFAMITVLFAAIFKVLPDANVMWREVWVGAVATAALFTAGKYLIGLYLGTSGAAGAFGAAGSLVLIILWVYYASMIVLFGAEFTRVWAGAHGRPIEPEPGAVKVIEEEEIIRPTAAGRV